MENIALYKEVNGKYPSMNCTVGKEIIDNPEATIGFFEQFGNRITFSRMIGKQGISLPDFNAFLNKAMERLNVRTGGYDCTMYGGMCGAGIDVIIAANVIQNEAAELFKDYLVFATRLSKNSFVGVNQSKQTGKTGPDTADRLFNLIKKRY